MSKFDNHVYMTICEITIVLAKNTRYATYSSYCEGMRDSIKDGYLDSREKDHIVNITKALEVVYSFTTDEINNYIIDCFDTNQWLRFERPVKLTKKYFPFVGNF